MVSKKVRGKGGKRVVVAVPLYSPPFTPSNRWHSGKSLVSPEGSLFDPEEIAQPIYPQTFSVPRVQARSSAGGSINELSLAGGSVMRINSCSLRPTTPPAAK